jgi:hypothetical protein
MEHGIACRSASGTSQCRHFLFAGWWPRSPAWQRSTLVGVLLVGLRLGRFSERPVVAGARVDAVRAVQG